MAKQLRRMEDLVTDISLYDVYHRIIRLFTRFTKNKNGDNSLSLIENLSHEELASMVGSVRKVVNRNLQKLKDEGVIELSRKHIKLKNFQKLLDKLHF
jgi:CRP-like cAMP-binding protein